MENALQRQKTFTELLTRERLTDDVLSVVKASVGCLGEGEDLNPCSLCCHKNHNLSLLIQKQVEIWNECAPTEFRPKGKDTLAFLDALLSSTSEKLLKVRASLATELLAHHIDTPENADVLEGWTERIHKFVVTFNTNMDSDEEMTSRVIELQASLIVHFHVFQTKKLSLFEETNKLHAKINSRIMREQLTVLAGVLGKSKTESNCLLVTGLCHFANTLSKCARTSQRLVASDCITELIEQLFRDTNIKKKNVKMKAILDVVYSSSEDFTFTEKSYLERFIQTESCYQDTGMIKSLYDKINDTRKGKEGQISSSVTNRLIDVIDFQSLLTQEERKYLTILGNDGAVQRVLKNLPPTAYLSCLKERATNDVYRRLILHFYEEEDNDLADLLESYRPAKQADGGEEATEQCEKSPSDCTRQIVSKFQKSFNRAYFFARRDGIEFEWLAWLQETVLKSLESMRRDLVTLANVTELISASAVFKLDELFHLAVTARPYQWLDNLLVNSILKAVDKLDPTTTGNQAERKAQRRQLTSDIQDCLRSPQLKGRIVLEVFRCKLEQETRLVAAMESVNFLYAAGLVSALKTLTKIDDVERFQGTSLKHWPRLIRHCKLTEIWPTGLANQLVTILDVRMGQDKADCFLERFKTKYGHVQNEPIFQEGNDLPPINSQLVIQLEGIVKNLSKYPWIVDSFFVLAKSQDVVNSEDEDYHWQHIQTQAAVYECIKERVENGDIRVPKCLESFVLRYLPVWTRNAFRAKKVTTKDSYKVDDVGDGRGQQIVIMDKETGVEQVQMQWSHGLHQFLQLKHALKLSPVSLKAVFMSNVGFFEQRKNAALYGMTGTLGSTAECKLLGEVFRVDFFKMPRFRRRFCLEEDHLLSPTKSQWLDNLVRATKAQLDAKRAVLVVCENIASAEAAYNKLLSACKQEGKSNKETEATIRVNISKYISSFDKGFQKKQHDSALAPGDVIVATNLAGRGTDFKIDEQLTKNGGLHVIIGYMPANARVEAQIEGRVARAGQPGSFQFVMWDPSVSVGKSDVASELCGLKSFKIDCLASAGASSGSVARFASTPSELMTLGDFFEKTKETEQKANYCYEQVVKKEPNDCPAAIIRQVKLVLREAGSDEKKNTKPLLIRAKNLIEDKIGQLSMCNDLVKKTLKTHEKPGSAIINENRFEEQTTNLISLLQVHLTAIDDILGRSVVGALAMHFPKEEEMQEILALITNELEHKGHCKPYRLSNSVSVRSIGVGNDMSEDHQSVLWMDYGTTTQQRRIQWPTEIAQFERATIQLIDERRNVLRKSFTKSMLTDVVITQNQLWEELIKEGYVVQKKIIDQDVIRWAQSKIESDSAVKNFLERLPKELDSLKTVLVDWLKRHDGEPFGDAVAPLKLDDGALKSLERFLKTSQIVVHINHRQGVLSKEISFDPNRSSSPVVGLTEQLTKFDHLIAMWILQSSSGELGEISFKKVGETVSREELPCPEDSDEGAEKIWKYLLSEGVIKEPKIAFVPGLKANKEDIESRKKEITEAVESLAGVKEICWKHRPPPKPVTEHSAYYDVPSYWADCAWNAVGSAFNYVNPFGNEKSDNASKAANVDEWLTEKQNKQHLEAYKRDVVSALFSSIGQLKTIPMVNTTLQPLSDYFVSDMSRTFPAEEMQSLAGKSLTGVIKLEAHKTWWDYWDRRAFYVAMAGVAQVALGVALVAISGGLLAVVGKTLISEGVSDIGYAIQAGLTGTFSWGGGGEVTGAARKELKSDGEREEDDQCGHLIAFLLGGGGGKKVHNLINMNSSLNQGPYKQLEKELAKFLEENENGRVDVDILLNEGITKGNSTSPLNLRFSWRLSDGDRVVSHNSVFFMNMAVYKKQNEVAYKEKPQFRDTPIHRVNIPEGGKPPNAEVVHFDGRQEAIGPDLTLVRSVAHKPVSRQENNVSRTI
ncbi:hypothetical protein GHT06_016981 [Daphnia sinensis]|uniref:SecA family profile domain-containing protein n=1 Tax=Daphnia sinensis TaxID=1820382 RepID=A0AAD5PUG9_9CRUS|nr:hypothetical protein GHT06_016981 [Daphnia sinensis]